MRNTPNLLLWTDSPGPYTDAIQQAGLADRVSIQALGRKAAPSEAQRADTHVLLAAGVPAGLLGSMPNLRWRHAPGVDAREHPWRAFPHFQALRRHRRGPETTFVAPSRRHAAERHD